MSARTMVRYKIDPKNPPKLTARHKRELAALAAMPDSEIDYSDAPPSPPDAKWTRPGALIPLENKQQITLRLDADVLAFFRNTGKRYQSRINAALREYVNNHRATT